MATATGAERPKWNLRDLLASPKGTLTYAAGESWLLHVFWECPSLAEARRVLAGLAQCAAATLRDTPCVVTYFFRLSSSNMDLCAPAPRVVGDVPALREAAKKLAVGVPAAAVSQSLVARGIDVALLGAAADTALPEAMQCAPVALECTEIYLDERAFMEHAGSRDYLDGYGVVMQPSGFHRVPTTVRLGTPPGSVVDGILESILHEHVPAAASANCLFRAPASAAACAVALLLSLDVRASVDSLDWLGDVRLQGACTSCLAFAHPLRAGECCRVLCVMPGAAPSVDALAILAAAAPERGEAHVVPAGEDAVRMWRAALDAAGLAAIPINATESVGYVLHPRASEIASG